MQYNVYKGSRIVGTVHSQTNGLYTEFVCHCAYIPGIHRLYGQVEDGNILFGVLVPCKDGLTMKKRFATAKLPNIAHFYINNTESGQGVFVPLESGDSFMYLKELQNCKFGERNGVKGIWVTELFRA